MNVKDITKPQNLEQLEKLIEYRKKYNKAEYLEPDDTYTRIAQIDADSIPYKVAHITNDLYEAFVITHNIIDNIMKETQSSHFNLYHTTSCNFRNDVIDNYKDNRKDLVKSDFYYKVRNMMIVLYNSTAFKCYEADDLVTMVHRKLGIYKSVLVSPDKDLLQVYPAIVYNPNKRITTKILDSIGELTLTVKEHINKNTGKLSRKSKVTGHGSKFLFWQLIAGDSTDNISGIPRIGAIGAYKILHEYNTLEELYAVTKTAYIKWYTNDYDKRKSYAKEFKIEFAEEFDINVAIELMNVNFKLLYMQPTDNTFKIPKPIELKKAYEIKTNTFNF